jgi:hypothetical protein
MIKNTKAMQEIINLLNEENCVLVKSIDEKSWVEKQGEVIRKITSQMFEKLKDLNIITHCNYNAYCRFEYELNTPFKS